MFRPKYKIKHTFIGSLKYNSDLYESITKIAIDEDICIGKVTAIGAVTSAVIGYFDQNKKQYNSINLSDGHEILNCTGNISLKEGKPFLHAHIILGNKDGKVFGGHLLPNTKVFACEVFIDEYTGEDLIRQKDNQTELSLWKNSLI